MWLYEYKNIKGPHLVIAPKSTISNWMNEFKKWAPFMRIVNLIPTMEMRDDIIKNQMKPGTFDVIITTYEAVKICHSVLNKQRWEF